MPFTAIERYGVRYGFEDPDDFDLLRRAVRAMDTSYLGLMREKMERKK